MSVALIAIRDRHAIIVSDGAVKATWPDGTVTRSRTAYPKFRAIARGIVIACTGSMLLNEQMYGEATALLARPSGATFDDLVSFLAMRLPHWHAEDDVRLRLNGTRGYLTPGSAVALVGLLPGADRARLIAFGATDGDYTPIEGREYAALGAVTLASSTGRLEQARDGGATWADMPGVMRGVVDTLSREHEAIGGNVYTCEIGPPPQGTHRVSCRMSVVEQTADAASVAQPSAADFASVA